MNTATSAATSWRHAEIYDDLRGAAEALSAAIADAVQHGWVTEDVQAVTGLTATEVAARHEQLQP